MKHEQKNDLGNNYYEFHNFANVSRSTADELKQLSLDLHNMVHKFKLM